jgi:hypothetical protein
MIKKLIIGFTGSFLLTCVFFSCKKETIESCVAGPGGYVTLIVFMQHNEHAVVNLKNYRDTVYVKYNRREFPGSNPTVYDEIHIGDWPGDSVVIPNLRCGDYYLYGVGFESIHSYRVSGGIPFSTDKKNGIVKVTIPVSE